jgi:hypothetical protein
MLTYEYYYAHINVETGLCIGIQDTSTYMDPEEYPEYVSIPEYNRAYLLKYYNRADGKWYTDAAFTVEATELN